MDTVALRTQYRALNSPAVRADVVGAVTPLIRGESLLLRAQINSAVIRSAEPRFASVDAAAAVLFTNAALRQMVNAINVALASDSAIKPVPLVLKLLDKIDFTAQLRRIEGVAQVLGPTIDLTGHLEKAVVLVSTDGLEIVSQLAAGTGVTSSPEPSRSSGTIGPGGQCRI